MPYDAEVEVNTRERVIQLRDRMAELSPCLLNMICPMKGDCNTPACVYGWAKTWFNKDFKGTYKGFAEFFGMSEVAASNLTIMGDQGVKGKWTPYNATPADIVRILDHYLATGVIDGRV